MKITYPLFSVVAIAAFASVSRADETYVLAKADHMPKAGSKHLLTKKMAMKDGVVKVKVGDQAIDGTCNMSETEAETVEYTSPTKVKRLVTAGEKSQKMVMNGQEVPDEPHPNALLKVPVTLTKAEGEWTAKLDGDKEASDEQQTELDKKEKDMDSDKEVTMYGSEAHKVGDTWTVDAADLPFSKGEEDTKGNLKITFKGVEDLDGKKCAHLEGPMEISGKTEEGQSISLKGKVVILRSIEDMVDLKVDFTGKMEMSGEIPNGTMTMSGEMTLSEATKLN